MHRLNQMLETLRGFRDEGGVGNDWYKANLHVHGKDNDPEEIIQVAREADIDLLAVTDHQTFKYCDSIIEAAEGTNITVLPGIEITTTEGVHLLGIFSSDYGASQRREFIGWLDIKREGDTRVASTHKVDEVLRKVADEGGIVIAPHPFSSDIGLLDSARKLQTRLDWLETGLVRLMQISDTHLDKIRYIGVDDEGKWVNRYVISTSTEEQVKKSAYCIAPLKRSDAHSESEVSDGPTWLRMAKPSIKGLQQVAFEPHTRIARTKPDASDHSRILGVEVTGGYCHGEVFQFNESLNCIVGQNYAGKSAIFDFIRFALGNDDDMPSESRDMLLHRLYGILKPGGVVTLYAKHGGQLFAIRREFSPEIRGEGARLELVDAGEAAHAYVLDEEAGRLNPVEKFDFPLEVYEQGRINRLRNDLDRQLRMLDDFAGSESLTERRDEIIRELHDSAGTMAPLKTELEGLNTESKTLPALKHEMKEKKKLLPDEDEQARWANSDATVREIESVIETLKKVKIQLTAEELSAKNDHGRLLFDLFNQSPPTVGEEEVAEKELVEEWAAVIEDSLERISSVKDTLLSVIEDLEGKSAEHREAWKEVRQARNEEVNSQLAEAGVTSPQEITTRVNQLQADMDRIEKEVEPRMEEITRRLEKEAQARTELKSNLRSLNQEITAQRISKASELTDTLKDQIKVEVDAAANRTEYREVLRELCNQVTSQSRKIMNREQQLDAISEGVTPLELSAALQSGGKIERENGSTTTLQEQCGVTDNTVSVLEGIGKDIELLNRLETTIVPDVPRIRVRRGGEATYADLRTELSPGEQSAAILTLALQTREMPLVVDQPEDELGYNYVVHLIVPKILDAKATRQLLVITHNANVPVLGDADYVIRMENNPHPDRGRECIVSCAGTFESESVTTALLELEGGEAAFKFRQDRYGLPFTG